MPILEVKLPNGRVAEINFTGEESPQEIQATVDVFAARNPVPADPTENMTALQRGAAGMGRGMTNVARQLGNMMGAIPDQYLKDVAEEDAALMNTTAGQVGSFLGELAVTAPLAGGTVAAMGKAASKAPALARLGASSPIRTGAAVGATEGALEGAVLAGPDNRLEGAAVGAPLGAVGGAGLPFVTQGFRKATPDAELIGGMNVDLTPGQMKPEGGWNRIEQALQSAPVVGDSVTAAIETPQVQFGQAMIEGALPPGAVPGARKELSGMLDDAYKQYDTAYDQFEGFYARPDTGPRIKAGFNRAVEDKGQAVSQDSRDTAKSFIDNQLTKIRGKDIMSEDLFSMRSALRKEGGRLKKAQKHDESFLIGQAEQAITEQIENILPIDLVKLNRAVDTQYGKYKIIEDALASAKDRKYPTPSQWSSAVKRAESSKGAYARGGGRLRPEVQAANEVFKTVSPATGARVATLGGLGALGATALGAAGLNDPMSAAYIGMPLALLAGSRGGRKFAAGQLPSQKTIEKYVKNFPVFGNDLTTDISPLIRGALPIVMTGEDDAP